MKATASKSSVLVETVPPHLHHGRSWISGDVCWWCKKRIRREEGGMEPTTLDEQEQKQWNDSKQSSPTWS